THLFSNHLLLDRVGAGTDIDGWAEHREGAVGLCCHDCATGAAADLAPEDTDAAPVALRWLRPAVTGRIHSCLQHLARLYTRDVRANGVCIALTQHRLQPERRLVDAQRLRDEVRVRLQGEGIL